MDETLDLEKQRESVRLALFNPDSRIARSLLKLGIFAEDMFESLSQLKPIPNSEQRTNMLFDTIAGLDTTINPPESPSQVTTDHIQGIVARYSNLAKEMELEVSTLQIYEDNYRRDPGYQEFADRFYAQKLEVESQLIDILMAPVDLDQANYLRENTLLDPEAEHLDNQGNIVYTGDPRHFRRVIGDDQVVRLEPTDPNFDETIHLDYRDYKTQRGKIRWVIDEKLIGAGGMGKVSKGYDTKMHRPVAVKYTRKNSYSKKYEAEAKAMARVKHPGIVEPIELCLQNEGFYIVMEYLDPETFPNLLNLISGIEYDLSNSDISEVVTLLCNAVDYLHDHQIVHNDIKPSNIFVSPDRLRNHQVNAVKLGDFGIYSHPSTGDLNDDVITPSVVAPEIMTDLSKRSPASDIYSVAVTTYMMITKGYAPKNEPLKNPTQYIPLSDPKYNLSLSHKQIGQLDELFQQALNSDPAQRPTTASEFARRFAEIIQNEPVITVSEPVNPSLINNTPLDESTRER